MDGLRDLDEMAGQNVAIRVYTRLVGERAGTDVSNERLFAFAKLALRAGEVFVAQLKEGRKSD